MVCWEDRNKGSSNPKDTQCKLSSHKHNCLYGYLSSCCNGPDLSYLGLLFCLSIFHMPSTLHSAQPVVGSLMFLNELQWKTRFLLANSDVMSISYFSESRKSRWDTSKQEKKEDSINEFLSLARSKAGPLEQESSPLVNKEEMHMKESLSNKVFGLLVLFARLAVAFIFLYSEQGSAHSVKG